MTKFVQIVPAHNTLAIYPRSKEGYIQRPVILWGLTEDGEVRGIVNHHDKLVDAESVPAFGGYDPMNPNAVIPGPFFDHSLPTPTKRKKRRPRFPTGPASN